MTNCYAEGNGFMENTTFVRYQVVFYSFIICAQLVLRDPTRPPRWRQTSLLGDLWHELWSLYSLFGQHCQDFDSWGNKGF